MFEGRIKLIERNELPGAAWYNPLARAIKFCRAMPPLLLLKVSPEGGMIIDFDIAALRRMLARPAMPFQCSVSGDTLLVTGGNVWLCDRKLVATGREKKDLDGNLAVWVRFSKTEARIRTGKDFPPALDITEKECNWPIAFIEDDKGTFIVHPRYEGDIVVLTMPHIFLPEYDSEALLMRICRNGNERYYATTECKDDE